jgi:signal peptidase I
MPLESGTPPPPLASRRRRPSPAEPRFGGWRKELRGWGVALLAAFVVVLLLRSFVFQLSTVRMHSMEPTLHERDWLFVNKVSYRVGHPRRGDIVILKDPGDGAGRQSYLVKRVIGIPGDRIEIRGGQLYLNGERMIEPYTDTAIEDGEYNPIVVGPGHYFVMGDNRRRGGSRDSRTFGAVEENRIKGRADFIVWPIVRWDRL